MKPFLLVILVSLVSTSFSFAQDEAYDICPIKNSQNVPNAVIYDIEGKAVDLKDYVGQKPTVVVFYRGGWCPYCIRHLSALGEIKEQIDALGFELIAITPDHFSKLNISKEKSGELGYQLFSDKDINAINAFGIGWKVNETLYEKYKNDYNMDIEWWSGSTHHVLPTPSVFIVNKGVIQYQHVNPKYKDRVSPEVLLSYLKAVNPKTESSKPVKKKLKTKVIDVEFPSLDKLVISAKMYEIDKTSPVIVLCHQARYNKYEYSSIALALNKKGFNCMAIDQRSGGEMKSENRDVFVNETSIRAKKEGKPTGYIDAEQDIIAAIAFAKQTYKSPLILWGSSYSSTLALYIAEEHEAVDAVVSFSPGNYLSEHKGSLIDKLPNLKNPVFITSSKQEVGGINQLLDKTTLGDHQVCFKPNGEGYHGSKALWPKQKGGDEYWNAIDAFLEKLKIRFSSKN